MKQLVLLLLLSCGMAALKAQNVGIGTASPANSALLDLAASDKGMLVPRMTAAQRDLIVNPAQGLLIYQTDLDTGFYYFKATAWKSLHAATIPSLNLIVYYKIAGPIIEIWTARRDGTNATPINIQLPVNTEFSEDTPPRLSPDGARVFFTLQTTADGESGTDLYSANINGSDIIKVIDKGGNGNYIILGGVY